MSRHRAGDSARAPWQEGTRESLAAVGLDPGWVREFVLRSLSEDLGPGWVDVTTAATVPVDDDRRAEVYAREDGVVCGLLLLPVVLAEAAARLGQPVPTADLRALDGTRVRAGDVLADLRGPTRVLLTAERTVINIIRHLSGVATMASMWVEVLEGTGAGLLDTRATTPGLRPLERYAVRCGGGSNGRAGLYDAAHVTVEHTLAAGSVEAALDAVRRRLPDALVQIDVRTPLEAVEAVLAGARFVVCERMHPDVLAGAVRQIRAATPETVEVAASGVVDLNTAKDYAQSGVDHLYVESLTQYATALDVGLVVA
ncbi:MAG TPA: carboxylating nicotinate-nucleotide diphosphorylase [Kineosporiaceae bacterium]|jgi:nicotinate-nucleotide pyrophosphorylase (carboxylating)|nr:carboxylating nicotinate-nucleotide diphosphorylase [Kineosporiaceae bacterium]